MIHGAVHCTAVSQQDLIKPKVIHWPQICGKRFMGTFFHPLNLCSFICIFTCSILTWNNPDDISWFIVMHETEDWGVWRAVSGIYLKKKNNNNKKRSSQNLINFSRKWSRSYKPVTLVWICVFCVTELVPPTVIQTFWWWCNRMISCLVKKTQQKQIKLGSEVVIITNQPVRRDLISHW